MEGFLVQSQGWVTETIGAIKKEAILYFTPPVVGVEKDWVLIIKKG